MSAERLNYCLYRVIRRTFYVLFRVLFRLEVRGLEHIPESEGCLLACNHASYLDPPLAASAIVDRPVHFMARGTLFRFPVFGGFLHRLGAIPLDRDRSDLSALRKGVKLLKDGRTLCLFPEGTRTGNGLLQEAKGGIGFIIAKAGVPVIPVYIEGSYKAWSKDSRIIRPCKIRVLYGEPIYPDQLPLTDDGKPDFSRTGELVMSRISGLSPMDK